MRNILVIGAGRIGHCIAELLHQSGRYQVTLADAVKAALKENKNKKIHKLHLDIYQEKPLKAALNGMHAVVSAASFNENPTIAEAALVAGVSYFDLTEDVATTRLIRQLAKKAKKGQIFMPQCGLAPGFVGILANDIAKRLDSIHTLKLRVGALPEFPSNQLMYNLTWSTEGLINEYCNPCEAIKNGKYTELRPLEGLETFSLDGVDFEAFNTSGGLGTLCETMAEQVEDLTYKTIRYPGHRYLMDFLIHGLRLGESTERRLLLKQIFENSIAVTHQDVVIVFVTATGMRQNKLIQLSEYYRVYHGAYPSSATPSTAPSSKPNKAAAPGKSQSTEWSAIQITTASSLCAVIDLHFTSCLPTKGFVRQEDVHFEDYINNEFCQPYLQGNHRKNTITPIGSNGK